MTDFMCAMPDSVNYMNIVTYSPKWERLSNEDCIASRFEWAEKHSEAMTAAAEAFVIAEKTQGFAEMYALKQAEAHLLAVRKLVVLNDVRASFNELANKVELDDECFDWLVSMEPDPSVNMSMIQMTDDEAFAFIIHYWNVQAVALKF
jgi:hypothetical protein